MLLEDEYKDRYSSSTNRMQNLNQEKEYRENMTSVHKGETDREEHLKQPPTTRRMLRFEEKIPERSLDQGYRETFNSSGTRARSLNIEEEYRGVRTEARKDAMFIDKGIENLPYDYYHPIRLQKHSATLLGICASMQIIIYRSFCGYVRHAG